MALVNTLQHSDSILFIACTLTGLFAGSIITLIAHRLPIMLERIWQKEHEEISGVEAGTASDFVTLRPECDKCHSSAKALRAIPVLSWLLLRRKCSECGSVIPARYPLVQILTALLSLAVAWKFGATWQTAFALLFTWALITLALIDFDTCLLPDVITLPLVWLGLVISTGAVFVNAPEAILGAAAGYLALWIMFHLFKCATGKEAMGYGDFKFLAALGAWLGWASLLPIVLLSSVSSAVISTLSIIIFKRSSRQPTPFGPYLAMAGWIFLILSDPAINTYSPVISNG